MLREIIKNERDDPTYSIQRVSNGNLSLQYEARVNANRSNRCKMVSKDLKGVNKEPEKTTHFLVIGRSTYLKGPVLHFLTPYDVILTRFTTHYQTAGVVVVHKSLKALLRLERRETSETNESNSLRFSVICTFEHFSPTYHDLWPYQETDVY